MLFGSISGKIKRSKSPTQSSIQNNHHIKGILCTILCFKVLIFQNEVDSRFKSSENIRFLTTYNLQTIL